MCSKSSSPTKFAVLAAGHVSPSCLSAFGDYGALYKSILSNEEAHEQWDVYKCVDNEFPSEDSLDSYRGFVISGSRHDAHSDLDWIVSLRRLVATIYERKRSNILGVCFGFQLVAIALGGSSGRAETAGWQVGLQEITTSSALQKRFPLIPKKFSILKTHRDQVSRLPPAAEHLASSEHTPNEMFSLGDRVFCIQGHPEFNCTIVKELVETRAETGIIPKHTADVALESMKVGQPNTEHLINAMKLFLNTIH